MTYLINLSLPLWAIFLPLGIAAVLAAKYYQSESAFSKMKSNYQAQLREAQNRLDEATKNSVSLTLALQGTNQLKDVSEKLHKAESDAVEREILVRALRADLANESEILQGRIKDKNAVISERDAQIEQLQSKLQLSELAHNETKEDLIGEKYYIDAIAEVYKVLYGLVKRNSRTRKQYDAVMQSIGEKRAFAMNNLTQSILELANKKASQKAQTKTIIDDGKVDGVVYDSLGTLRVFQADQSESVNNRHEIVNICNEVNRGIAEQAQRIKEELASVVDMSQLQVGDSIEFRNSTVKTVVRLGYDNRGINYLYWIMVDSNEGDHWRIKDIIDYTTKGYYYRNEDISNFDIIQIIKPAKSKVKFEPQEGDGTY